ncbi:MAG: hypothetical protein JXN64_14390 [Spirochaetes bacterium]|nr:hypothetical protein [Spirochaetota bacterium]
MKYKIIITLTSLIIATALRGDENRNNPTQCIEPENFTPSTAALFIEISSISKAVDFLNAEKDSHNIGNVLTKNIKWIKELKDKTGVDVLNTKSLKNIGIDINKALYITGFGYKKNEPKSVFFLPIIDKKNFPINFVKLLKIINDDKTNPDINPAISTYKDIRVFQIPNKIFFAVIDNYFILASSGNALTDIIDIKTQGCETSLAANPLFKDYKSKSDINIESSILKIFIRKEYLDNTYETVQGKEIKKDLQAAKPNLNFIDYISLSLDSETDEVSFMGRLSVNKEDPYGDLLIKVFTTDLFENALFAENPTGYHFLSIDVNKINEHFKAMTDKNDSAYKAYTEIMKPGRNTHFLKDAVLPCSKSFFNIIFQKPKTASEMDNFIVYIPMEECGDIKKTLKNLQKELENNHTEEGTFGEEKIDGHNSFWFKNSSHYKINILGYKGNIYAGNDIGLLKEVLKSSEKKSPDIKNDFTKRIDKNTFLISYTQFDDESFLKAVLMMLAYNNTDLYGFISKIESINLTGKKIDNDLMLNLRLKMLRSHK